MSDLDPDTRLKLAEHVRHLIDTGEDDPEELADLLEEFAEDDEDVDADTDGEPLTPGDLQEIVGAVWARRLAEQTGWPEGPTDPERVDAVLDALDARGITARGPFTCCRPCGLNEIAAEAGPGARGFVFYHQQSAERAVHGGDLMLYYGGFDDSEGTTTAVGREVVTALAGEGLDVRWGGSPDEAIAVTSLTWRRRVPA